MVPSKLLRLAFLMVIGVFAGATALAQVPSCAEAHEGDGFIIIAERCGVEAGALIEANRAQRWYRSRSFVPRGVTLVLPSAVQQQQPPNPYERASLPNSSVDAAHTKEDLRVKQRLSETLKENTSLKGDKQALQARLDELGKETPPVSTDLEQEIARMREELELSRTREVGARQTIVLLEVILAIASIIGIIGFVARRRARSSNVSTAPVTPVAGAVPDATASRDATTSAGEKGVGGEAEAGDDLKVERAKSKHSNPVLVTLVPAANLSGKRASDNASSQRSGTVTDIFQVETEAEIARMRRSLERDVWWYKAWHLYPLRRGVKQLDLDGRISMMRDAAEVKMSALRQGKPVARKYAS